MAFGRVCILGDAAFVSRPHTAAGVSKAATNAVALANLISNPSNVNVVEALKWWKQPQVSSESLLEIGHNLTKSNAFKRQVYVGNPNVYADSGSARVVYSLGNFGTR